MTLKNRKQIQTKKTLQNKLSTKPREYYLCINNTLITFNYKFCRNFGNTSYYSISAMSWHTDKGMENWFMSNMIIQVQVTKKQAQAHKRLNKPVGECLHYNINQWTMITNIFLIVYNLCTPYNHLHYHLQSMHTVKHPAYTSSWSMAIGDWLVQTQTNKLDINNWEHK